MQDEPMRLKFGMYFSFGGGRDKRNERLPQNPYSTAPARDGIGKRDWCRPFDAGAGRTQKPRTGFVSGSRNAEAETCCAGVQRDAVPL